MALIGLSLLFASVVWVLVRPPRWMPALFLQWRGLGGTISEGPSQTAPPRGQPGRTEDEAAVEMDNTTNVQEGSERSGKAGMPPPPVPRLSVVQPPADDATPRIAEPETEEEDTTPKVSPAVPSIAVPSFSLSPDTSSESGAASSAMAPPPVPPTARRAPAPAPGRLPPVPQFPAANSPQRAQGPQPGRLPPVPQFPAANSPQRAQGPQPGRLPVVPQFPAANSAQRAQGPLPNRGPPGSSSSSSGLAPPPTHSSKPSKPSRKVLLSPGHSPLDWARISGPNADLRGVPGSTSYLRVTPSMLKKQTGRKGTDAWMALNGKVYNVTPYAEFHPGGVPELMRGAGRDGTKLYGEVHPWVNYESMLAACLVGLLVDEPDGQESEMDKMD